MTTEPFVKLLSSVTDSSIWVYDDQTRIVWITMLAMANRTGVVNAAIPGIANRARVPVEAAQKAIDKFMEPDPYSRNTDYEGRRVARVDGGFKLLNYERIRGTLDIEREREKKRRWWEKNRSKAALDELDHERPQETDLDTSRSRSRSRYKESSKEDSCLSPDKPSPKKRQVVTYPEAFESIWSFASQLWKSANISKACPIGTKSLAYAEWSKMKEPFPDNDEMRNRLGSYVRYCEHTRCFLKNLSTWIHQRGWEGDYDIAEEKRYY